MRKITVFLIIPFIIIAETLEIPEITVYGERQIRIEPVEKGLLPFEEEPILPTYERKRANLPSIKEEKRMLEEKNKGIRARAEAGSKFEGYLIGYLRNYYYPLEIGVSGLYNSDIAGENFQMFARMNLRDFYLNTSYLMNGAQDKILTFTINGFSKILSGGVFLVYSDSLLASANLELFLIPFDLELEIDDEFEYMIKASYEKYPLKAGISWYKMHLFPEFLYFFPFNKSLYIKGNLSKKNGISRSFIRLPQFQWEWSFLEPFYRIEFGQGGNFGASMFYSRRTLTDSLSYLGISTNYKGFQLEVGYPLAEGDPYLRVGGAVRVSDLIDVNLYGFLHDIDNYFLITDFGFLITKRLKIGASGTIIKGWEDDFNLTGYLSFWL